MRRRLGSAMPLLPRSRIRWCDDTDERGQSRLLCRLGARVRCEVLRRVVSLTTLVRGDHRQ